MLQGAWRVKKKGSVRVRSSPNSETLMASLSNSVTQVQSNIPVKFDRALQSNNNSLLLSNTTGQSSSPMSSFLLSSSLSSSSSPSPLVASLSPGQGSAQGQGLAQGPGLSHASLSPHMIISSPLTTLAEGINNHSNHSTIEDIHSNQASGPGLGSYQAQTSGPGLSGNPVNQRPSVRFAGPYSEEEELEEGGMGREGKGQDRAVINHAAATLQVREEGREGWME